MSDAAFTMNATLFGKFSDIIYELTGIRFEENKTYFLTAKLGERAAHLNLHSLEEYWQYLQSPSGRMEYGHMVDAVTINETFFYRNLPQLQAFEHNILEPMAQEKRTLNKKMRIWSCATSTGDEAYTLALMFASNPTLANVNVEIIGSDICQHALSKAQIGVYTPYAVHNIPKPQLAKFFIHNPSDDKYILSEAIKNMVTLKICNLIDVQAVKNLGMFDIIFCRNVLIYFDDFSKDTAVTNITSVLKPDGYVIMGHSENIYGQRRILKADKTHMESIAYVHPPARNA